MDQVRTNSEPCRGVTQMAYPAERAGKSLFQTYPVTGVIAVLGRGMPRPYTIRLLVSAPLVWHNWGMTRSTGTLALAGCNLAVAGLQLLFFLPVVEGWRAHDVALWGGGPLLLRVDRLSLLFGVVWAVALVL